MQMDTLDLVYDTMQYAISENADWSKLTRLQLELKSWLEKQHE